MALRSFLLTALLANQAQAAPTIPIAHGMPVRSEGVFDTTRLAETSSPSAVNQTYLNDIFGGPPEHDYGLEPEPVDEEREQYLHLLAHSLTGTLNDEAGSCVIGSPGGCSAVKLFDTTKRETGIDYPPFGQTTSGHKRLENIRFVIEKTVKDQVPGDFADLGIWRGGTSIFAKALYNLEGQTDRKVHMFDVFHEMPLYGNMASFLGVSAETVEHNLKKYKVHDDNMQIHQGLWKDSLPKFLEENPNVQLSVLRVDGNFYDSYQDALYYLYPKVAIGGYIIFDDLSTDSSHEKRWNAWMDFKQDQGIPGKTERIDENSRFFRKMKDAPIDMSKMKPPSDINIITT